jgi:hypothetical protein
VDEIKNQTIYNLPLPLYLIFHKVQFFIKSLNEEKNIFIEILLQNGEDFKLKLNFHGGLFFFFIKR